MHSIYRIMLDLFQHEGYTSPVIRHFGCEAGPEEGHADSEYM